MSVQDGLSQGQAAKKIGDAVSGKATKYAKLNAPLVVFVMFGQYNVGDDARAMNPVEKTQ